MPNVEQALKEIEGRALTLSAAHTAAMSYPPDSIKTDLCMQNNRAFIDSVQKHMNLILEQGTRTQLDRFRDMLDPLEWCRRQR